MNAISLPWLVEAINQSGIARAIWLDENVISVNGRIIQFNPNGTIERNAVKYRCTSLYDFLQELSIANILNFKSNDDIENILCIYRRITDDTSYAIKDKRVAEVVGGKS